VTQLLQVAEPPARFRARPPLVVDCSALATIVFQEPGFEAAAARLLGHQLHAPQLLQAELANVAVTKHRLGQADALEALGRAAELEIALYALDLMAVGELAIRCKLTAYDAAYLWLAEQLRCPLVTFDERLGRAAVRHLGGLGGAPG
jgi:predicted nucleic acid-binding protein